MATYEVEVYGSIRVFWTPALSGGGRSYGQQFVPAARQLFGRVGRLFEFCAGPGFIGFSMLAEGLCETLCLADINPEAVKALRRTVEENGLGDRVTVYEADGLDGIPAGERWDLAVSNPPHFAVEAGRGIVTDDPGWGLHRRFYADVGRFLAPSGNVLLQENYVASGEEDFLPMIEAGGLRLIDSFMCDLAGAAKFNPYYFLWSRRAQAGTVPRSSPPLSIEVAPQTERALEVAHGAKFALRVSNDGGAPIDVWLRDEAGRPLSLVPLAHVPARTSITTRPLMLAAGSYALTTGEGCVLAIVQSL